MSETNLVVSSEAMDSATQQKAIASLTEQLERVTAERNAALEARGQTLPLMREAKDALAYCSKLKAFAEGGEHRGGFVATVGPVLQHLEAWLTPRPPASPGGAQPDAGLPAGPDAG